MTAAICFGVDHGSPAGDTTALSHYDGTTGQWRVVASTPHPAEDGIAACIGCGCTDDRACLGGCWWLAVDRAAGKGVCCYCEEHLQAFYSQQASARLDLQEAEAREAIARTIKYEADRALWLHREESRDIEARLDRALDRHRADFVYAMNLLTWPGFHQMHTGGPVPITFSLDWGRP